MNKNEIFYQLEANKALIMLGSAVKVVHYFKSKLSQLELISIIWKPFKFVSQ